MKDNICYEPLNWIGERVYEQRIIVSAANRFTLKSGRVLVVPCVRHYSKDLAEIINVLKNEEILDNSGMAYGENQGFIDQYSNYWTRREALIIATAANQINVRRRKSFPEDELFSEDLY